MGLRVDEGEDYYSPKGQYLGFFSDEKLLSEQYAAALLGSYRGTGDGVDSG